MNEPLLKKALHYLADQAIPENEAPRLSMRKQIETVLRSRQPEGGRAWRQPRLRLAGLAALLVILAGAIFLVTPQGQALAQDVFHFFTVAENDVLPLPAGQPTEQIPATRTAGPTQIVALQAVTPAVNASSAQSYPTTTPAAPGDPMRNLTLDQAAQLAGFALRIPASLPPGYRLDNVLFDPGRREVTQFYGFHPYTAGEQFILHQQPTESAAVIGPSAQVEQLTIAGVPVEYVRGTWLNTPDANTETWHSDSIYHTYRWQAGDSYFTLEILFDDQDTWSPAYWTPDGMRAMVEIVMGARTEFPAQVNFNNLASLDQAQAAAGFELLVPAALPEGFVFSRAGYDPQTGQVSLFFQPQDGSRDSTGVRLVIVEKPVSGQSPENWAGYPAGAVETVLVGSSQATFVRGTIVDGVYQPDTELYLVWNTPDLSIKMIYSTRSDYPTRLEKDELIAIAESLE